MSTTLPFITAGANLVSSVTPFFAGQSEARAEQSLIMAKGESEAQSQEFNIGVAQQEIAISKSKRSLESKREQKKIKSFVSSQCALFAKAGVTLSGSPLAVIEESIAEAEMDVLIGDINAEIEQSRLMSEIEQRQLKAEQSRAFAEEEGKQVVREMRARTATTLLTDVAKSAVAIADLFPTKPKVTGKKIQTQSTAKG